MDTLSQMDRAFLRNIVTSLIAAVIPADRDRVNEVKLQEMNHKINNTKYVPRSEHEIVTDVKIEHARVLVSKVFDGLQRGILQ